MKIGNYLVPHDGFGGVPHYTSLKVGQVDDPEKDWHTGLSVHGWRPNDPFGRSLKIGTLVSGQSAKYFWWRSVADPDVRYPMFASDLMALVQEGEVRKGVAIGQWRVIKRGQNYGIRWVGYRDDQ